MVEVSKRSHIGAKSACRRFEYATMMHTKNETDVIERERTVPLEVPALSVLLEVRRQVVRGNSFLALLVTVLTLIDTIPVLLCECRTLNINQGDQRLLLGHVLQALLLLDEWLSYRYDAAWRA
jgi:hypothetical protein